MRSSTRMLTLRHRHQQLPAACCVPTTCTPTVRLRAPSSSTSITLCSRGGGKQRGRHVRHLPGSALSDLYSSGRGRQQAALLPHIQWPARLHPLHCHRPPLTTSLLAIQPAPMHTHLPLPQRQLAAGDGHRFAVAQHHAQQMGVRVLRLLRSPEAAEGGGARWR